jgi:F-type H+-transporting ATPase subunit a
MFLGEYIVFSLNIFGWKLPITDLFITAFCYCFICLFIAFKYSKRGCVFFICNKVYNLIRKLSIDNTGTKKHTSILLCFFIVIALLNTMRCFFFPPVNGLLLFPIAYASIIFLYSLFLGFKKHGLLFFWNLAPSKMPIAVKPFMALLETFILFTKPLTLCIRLWLNISIGYLVVHSLHATAETFGVAGNIAVPIFIFLHLVELGIGILQAYVFTVFSSLMIGMCTNDHH